jgi:ABC-type phosphate transport system permease subunit
MENIFEILQTIGICVSAIALTFIAIMVFVLWSTFFPAPIVEDIDGEFFTNGEEWEEEEPTLERKRRRRKRK